MSGLRIVDDQRSEVPSSVASHGIWRTSVPSNWCTRTPAAERLLAERPAWKRRLIAAATEVGGLGAGAGSGGGAGLGSGGGTGLGCVGGTGLGSGGSSSSVLEVGAAAAVTQLSAQ